MEWGVIMPVHKKVLKVKCSKISVQVHTSNCNQILKMKNRRKIKNNQLIKTYFDENYFSRE
jgi:hypothetical protein